MEAVALPSDVYILATAALLVVGVLLSGVAHQVRVPGLIVFMVVGMAIGSDGLDLIGLSDPGMAQFGAVIALVLILFDGGLTTKPGDVRRAAGPGMVLATVGVAITAAVTAAGAWLVLDLDWTTALLIGCVVSSTDAAAVFAVLRKSPLPRRLTALVEVESASNDPMAILLTVAVIASIEAAPTVGEVALFLLRQLGGGLLLGLGIGIVAVVAMRRMPLASGLFPVLTLGVAGLAYGTGAAIGTSGFLAVYVVGLLIGALVPRHRRAIRQFHDGLAEASDILLFLLLGLLVFPSQLPGVALPTLAVSAVLVFVARPLAVWLIVPWFGYSVRETTWLSWAGLRGAVPIVLATFPLTAGVDGGDTIFNVVFFVVLVSTTLQGTTVAWLGRRFGLSQGADVWAPIAEAVPLEGVDADMIEVDIFPELAVAGRRVRDVPLPSGARLTAVLRRDQVIIPDGDTELRPGDLALVAVPRRETATQEIVAWARGET